MIGRRISVIGTTGSGKTTLARQLAEKLDLRHIELDSLHWEPNWTEPPINVFRDRVSHALSVDRWVIDGNYSKVRDIIWRQADTVVWLDYPLPLTMRRLFKRTIQRVVTREELWNGNRESWRDQFFSKNSLFLWALNSYFRRRKETPDLLSRPENAHLQVIRLYSPAATRRWFESLTAETVQGENFVGEPG
jgi:adenylate kinase family enzyme